MNKLPAILIPQDVQGKSFLMGGLHSLQVIYLLLYSIIIINLILDIVEIDRINSLRHS